MSDLIFGKQECASAQFTGMCRRRPRIAGDRPATLARQTGRV